MKKDDRKKLDLKTLNLSSSERHKLYGLFSHIFYIASHDLLSIAVNFKGFADEIGLMSNEIKSKYRDLESLPGDLLETLEELLEFLSIMQRSAKDLVNFSRILFPPLTVSNFESVLIAKPASIVALLSELNSRPDIQITKSSQRSLEFVYPENVLAGIFTELVNNAQHAGSSTVLFDWSITNSWFSCQVHDNGPGIETTLSYKPSLIDTNQNRFSGLRIISTIISTSGGLMLFAKSKNLGGTVVQFELPVIHYYIEK